jgi:hypothetical protein
LKRFLGADGCEFGGFEDVEGGIGCEMLKGVACGQVTRS